MPLDLTDDKSTLVQVMAWCRQANVDPDLCRQMASLGLNELTHRDLDKMYTSLQTNFHLYLMSEILIIPDYLNFLMLYQEKPRWQEIDTNSGNGMVPAGNKPSPDARFQYDKALQQPMAPLDCDALK